jgi:Flp pilus assembly protein TadD
VDEYDFFEDEDDDLPSELHVSAIAKEEAERLHTQAMALAQDGQISDALNLFHQARDLNPAKDVYWSNLGVTQMRLNLLDDALVSLTTGEKLNPTSTLIQENLKALRGALPSCAGFG